MNALIELRHHEHMMTTHRRLAEEAKKVLGREIARLRELRGLSQREAYPLLKAAGINPKNLAALERPSSLRSHSSNLIERTLEALKQ